MIFLQFFFEFSFRTFQTGLAIRLVLAVPDPKVPRCGRSQIEKYGRPPRRAHQEFAAHGNGLLRVLLQRSHVSHPGPYRVSATRSPPFLSAETPPTLQKTDCDAGTPRPQILRTPLGPSHCSPV